MEQMARPGTALLTAQTLRLVEGRMEVMPVGALPVKGMAEPVEAYELKGVTGARSRLEAVASPGLTPFIGRDAEMAALTEAADRAAAGRGQVVAVLGEPGVGKSRLILEFTRSARLRDWVALEGHATDEVDHNLTDPLEVLRRKVDRALHLERAGELHLRVSPLHAEARGLDAHGVRRDREPKRARQPPREVRGCRVRVRGRHEN